MRFILFSAFIIIMNTGIVFSQQDTTNENTIIQKPEKKSSKEMFQEEGEEDKLPGAEKKFTPQQDSAYARAKRLNMPISTRLRYDLMTLQTPLISLDREGDTFAPGMEQLPADAFQPDPNMIVQHEENIMRSFEVPYLRTYNPYGTKVPLSDIGKFFGLTEDYSSTVRFRVNHYTHVEVVIYSIQATVVATIYKGHLPPGNYERTWNGRDQNGRKLPDGDYVAEVRIKGEQTIRKRIILK